MKLVSAAQRYRHRLHTALFISAGIIIFISTEIINASEISLRSAALYRIGPANLNKKTGQMS